MRKGGVQGKLRWCAQFVALAASIILTFSAAAQSVRGTLAGTVTDTSGAVISGAKIAATETATGLSVKTVSTSAGEYRFPQLPIGIYNLTVEAPGFSASTYTDITVTVNSVVVQNVQLKPGAVSQTVTVNADALALQTESSELGGTVTTRSIIQLPLGLGGMDQLRAPEAFATLLPGVIGPGTGTTAGSNTGGIYYLKIGGGQDLTAEILLDGISMDRGNMGGTFDETAPSVEALQEFKITTSLPEAQFGRTGGGIESFSTKSGTNAFHGTAFELFQNDAMNADTWFNNGHRAVNCTGANNTPACNAIYRTPNDKQNDFGGSVGGFVWLPHIYNGRNKTFFFVSWEKFLENQGSTITSTVPTAAERNGDFSAYLQTGEPLGTNPCDGSTIYFGQIFDPATTKTVGGVPCRTAFPGNKITGGLSNAGKSMLSYWPNPTNSALAQNYTFPFSYPIVNLTWTVRGDETLTEKQQIFVSLNTRINAHQTNSPALPVLIDPNGWPQNFSTHYFRAGWEYAIKPTLLNHLAFGTNRVNGNNLNEGLRQGTTNYTQKMGIGNVNSSSFPVIRVGEGIVGMGIGNNADNIAVGLNLIDSLSWQRGKHSFTFGGDIRFFQFSTLAKTVPSFTFGRGQTAAANLPTILSDSGNGLASLEIGDPTSASQTVYAHNGRFQHWYYAGYAQDDFKATSALTLNLGLRYDLAIPWSEADNQNSNFSPTAIDPAYNIPGALVFASNCNCNTRWANTWYKDIGPRLGFAWSPKFWAGKTVLRGGAGILYGPLQYNNNFSWTGGYSVAASPASSDSFTPAFSLDSGFPAFAPPPNLNPGLFNGQAISSNYIPANQGRPPAIYQIDLGIEQQLSRETIFSLGYMGMIGTHLASNFENPNNIPISAFALGNQLTASATNNTAGVAPPFAGFTTLWKGGQVQQALRPFPQYLRINASCCVEMMGHSSYHALLASVQRRFSNGLSYIASYTWSKNLNDAGYSQANGNKFGIQSIQNPLNLKGEKAIDMQDIPQQFVSNFLYNLPFGNDRRFMNHTNALVDAVLGGWELGGVLRYESGTPVSFGCASAIPGWDNCSRYSLTGSSVKSSAAKSHTLNPLVIKGGLADPSINSLWNGASFGAQSAANQTAPAFYDQNNAHFRGTGAYTFGNSPRVSDVDRMNPFFNEDFSMLKTFPIHENLNFVLKVESFNTFNRHAWALPDESLNDPLFGVPTSTMTGPRFMQITGRILF